MLNTAEVSSFLSNRGFRVDWDGGYIYKGGTQVCSFIVDKRMGEAYLYDGGAYLRTVQLTDHQDWLDLIKGEDLASFGREKR